MPIVSAAASLGPLTGSGARLDPEPPVTPRQLEVLALVASGYSYARIAAMKFYSLHTVQNHVNAAVARTGARNTTQLCAMLVERGMIRRNETGDYQPVVSGDNQDLRIVEE